MQIKKIILSVAMVAITSVASAKSESTYIKCGVFGFDIERIDRAEVGDGKGKQTFFVNEETYIDKVEGGAGRTIIKVLLNGDQNKFKDLEEGRSYCFTGTIDKSGKFTVKSVSPQEAKIKCKPQAAAALTENLSKSGFKTGGHANVQNVRLSCHMQKDSGKILCSGTNMVTGAIVKEFEDKGARLSASIEKCGLKTSGHYQVIEAEISCHNLTDPECDIVDRLDKNGDGDSAGADGHK